jgi:plasmid stabilization system protein ParE
MRSWLSIRPAVVREGSVSTDRQRRHRSSVLLLLVTAEAPEIALRFREAVRRTIQSLVQNPNVGPRYFSGNPRLQNLRSWPVAGFEAIRIYYALEAEAMHIIRILHGERDMRRILGNE